MRDAFRLSSPACVGSEWLDQPLDGLACAVDREERKFRVTLRKAVFRERTKLARRTAKSQSLIARSIAKAERANEMSGGEHGRRTAAQ
jgi:hypothetical protein